MGPVVEVANEVVRARPEVREFGRDVGAHKGGIEDLDPGVCVAEVEGCRADHGEEAAGGVAR